MSQSKKKIFIAEIAAVSFMAVCLILFIGHRFTNKAKQVSYMPVTRRPEIQHSDFDTSVLREEAEALFKNKRYLEAQKVCNRILARNKFDHDVVLLRGKCLFFQNQYDKAKIDFFFLVDDGQHLYAAYRYVGGCFYKQQQYSSAKTFFEKALQLAESQKQKNNCYQILDLITRKTKHLRVN